MTKEDREQREESEQKTDSYFRRTGLTPEQEEWLSVFKEELEKIKQRDFNPQK